MKNMRYVTRKALPKRSALAVALALSMGVSGLAYGQATSGTIYGTAPAGDTVQVTSNSTGVSRTIAVGTDGNYAASNLPLGAYTVTLQQNGQTISTRNNVTVRVGSGVAVRFAAAGTENAQNLSAVQVTASALPAIDVTTVHNSTVITASDLARLPLGRNAEAIALLTPGTVQGSTYFGNTVSFGGSSGAENAYYVNGYNTGNMYTNIGGYQLPYGAIAQQETLADGFSAKYGRSDGGVINQVGKRGTNEWHFGGQIVWQPRSMEASPQSSYYPSVALPSKSFAPLTDSDGNPIPGTEKFKHEASYKPGAIRSYNGDDKSWETVYTAYIGGPLIRNKLFIFLDAEVGKTQGTSVATDTSPTETFYSQNHTKFYGKLDWNINDSNVFQATFLKSKSNGSGSPTGTTMPTGPGAVYNYDYDTFSPTTYKVANDEAHVDAKFLIAEYTSYITDNATFHVLYGKGEVDNPTVYGYKGNLPLISNGSLQNPAYWGAGVDSNTGIINDQPNAAVNSPDSHLSSRGLRADFTYVLGNHTLGVGIDNMYYSADAQGTHYTGGPAPSVVTSFNGAPLDGTRWIYRQTNSGDYVVDYYNIENVAGMTTKQKAYYLQDVWQVTPTVQLNIGVRNDHYTNYNNVGQAFVDEKNQWSPRLGASWDVFGDSSFKVWGNAGRYYLALPQNAANRAADSSVFISQRFHYTGIDAETGVPTGLTPVTPHVTSPDGEFGGIKDPKQVTAANLRPMYIDQYNLGFDKKLGDSWVYGAKLSYRDLKTTIDDECDPSRIAAKMTKMGLDPDDYSYSLFYGPAYCRLINPGQSSDMMIQKDSDGSYVKVPMTFSDWGYPQKPKRTYKAVNLYLEHPFDGKWFGRIDYTYTDAKGNTSGQIRPDFGQGDVSKTEDWDSAALMEGQDGELLNSRHHIIRIRGAYQITPEWLVSGTAMIQSGTPQECLGYYGPDASGDPTGYNNGGTGNYHWCAGEIVHPGSDSKYAGHTPWTHILNLGVRYTPAFADHKLALKLYVFNALNEQKPVQTIPSYANGPHVAYNLYHYPVARMPARYIRFSVSYDY